MTQPAASPVTLEKAWARLMSTMGRINVQRARDAKKAAAQLTRDRLRY